MISKARAQIPRDLRDEVAVRRFLGYLAEQVDIINGYKTEPGYVELTNNAVTIANEAKDLAGTATALAQAGSDGAVNYYQDDEPLEGNAGDLWFDTNDNNKMYKHDGTGWSLAVLNDNVTTIDGGKITTGTINAALVNVSNINAGNITSGTLSAITLSGNTIVGGAISGASISTSEQCYFTGQVNARNIYATNSSVTNIFSGPITCYGRIGNSSYGDMWSNYFEAGTGSGGGAGNAYGLSTGTYKAYVGGGVEPFTGIHIGYTQDSLEVGDIVSADDAWVISVVQTLVHLSNTSTSKDKKVFGVVSHASSDLLNHITENPLVSQKDADDNWSVKPEYVDYINYMIDNNFTEVSVNALGEGGINVCSENGDILAGDYICSSNTLGKGMKQDEEYLANYTVAKALESVIWADEPNNTKMIACTYHCG